MTKCLVAEYFQKYNAQDLCVNVWCNQDFALAEMWGAKLERTTTLAEGCTRCDFRFMITP
ncbi:MAG: L-2-amino-thiazoline-4-carboxylic acid hydrolase [Candidatus Marinimicrobia bacterium]|nr:L-2-amino-thiazoline-4-carboxylic acid hydrolase [Candidatus Neomarinimicrobiota bacterium]